jgi:hypothetical protein
MAPERATPLGLARGAWSRANPAAGRVLWTDGAPASLEVNRAESPPSREGRP